MCVEEVKVKVLRPTGAGGGRGPHQVPTVWFQQLRQGPCDLLEAEGAPTKQVPEPFPHTAAPSPFWGIPRHTQKVGGAGVL